MMSCKTTQLRSPGAALRADYKWLADRLEQGVADEENRLNKLGKGIKRKLALALLTARISDRQKDSILERLTEVVEGEISQKSVRITTKTSETLPSLLRQKIDEVQVAMGILQQEKQTAEKEMKRVNKENEDLAISLSRTEQNNRQLEVENHSLQAENKQMEESLRRLQSGKWESEKDREKELVVWNKDLDIQNTKLTRDIQKFSTANAKLRKECKPGSGKMVAKLKSEHKKLTEERLRLKKDVQKLDEDKRKLTIRMQKLTSENQHLRDQKKKLASEKKKAVAENKELKKEAKRLALGKQVVLPPISDKKDRDRAKVKDGMTVQSRSERSRSPNREDQSTHLLDDGARKKADDSPWNKYKEDTRRHGSGDQENDIFDDSDKASKKQPSYMVSTASSRRKDYLSSSFREESPTPTAAHKRFSSYSQKERKSESQTDKRTDVKIEREKATGKG
ncbi:hypothetical protein C0Q70_08035 [Pomacea canaliculata]|uniref:Uncharacterized protein n=1 Tax=Pomacea canaliculata TaxID=400727 RepID=A0A2T7PGP2_POMCA|nr:hypothetical protein C0Q70_08035 [Pomacea canaliculata]